MGLQGCEFQTDYQYFKVILDKYSKLCKQTREEMCSFEAYLICFGLGNIFQPPALFSKMWYVCELNVI